MFSIFSSVSYELVFQLFVSNEWFFFLLEHFFSTKKTKLAFKNNLSPFQLIFCVSVTIELFSWKLVEDRTTTTKLLEDNNRNRRWNKEKTFDVYFLIFDVSPEKLSSKKTFNNKIIVCLSHVSFCLGAFCWLKFGLALLYTSLARLVDMLGLRF